MFDIETQIADAMASGSEGRVAFAAELARALPRPRKARDPGVAKVAVPLPLQSFFARVGDGCLGVQDRIVEPRELTIYDEKLVFAEENQSVCEWACDLAGSDPPVFIRHHAGGPWLSEGVDLSVFLLRFMVFERIMSSEHVASAACLPSAALERLLSEMRPLPLPYSHWPEHPGRYFARGDALAFESPNGEGVHTLWVAGELAEDIAFVAPHVSEHWD